MNGRQGLPFIFYAMTKREGRIYSLEFLKLQDVTGSTNT